MSTRRNWSRQRTIARFLSEPTTHWLLFLLTTLWASRLTWACWPGSGGAFGLVDLAAAVGVVCIHPLVEWMTHVFLLHTKPFTIGRWTLDLPTASKHRRHHYVPDDLTYVFMPPIAIIVAFSVAVLGLVVFPSAVLLTAFATFMLLGVVFEWSHYLCHVPYRPRSRYLQLMRRRHLWHHYRNENYWWGVSTHLGDRLLGTLPRRRADVPLSPTATNLHHWQQSGPIILSGRDESGQ